MPTAGRQGGRPDDLKYEGGEVFHQFGSADLDPPDLRSDQYDDPSKKEIYCSYLFEFNGEKCEWIGASAPEDDEWVWVPSKPSGADFVELALVAHLHGRLRGRGRQRVVGYGGNRGQHNLAPGQLLI